MKIDWNKKYTTIAVYSFIVLALSIIFYLIASEVSEFRIQIDNAFTMFSPIILGLTFAYLLNFILKVFEEKLMPILKVNKKHYRSFSLILTYISVSIGFYLFFIFILPQLIESLVGIVNDLPLYANQLSTLINDLSTKFQIAEEYYDLLMKQWNDFINYMFIFLKDLIPILGNVTRSIISSIMNIILAIIISVYVLAEKEMLLALSRKMTNGLFPEKVANKSLQLVHRANVIFGNFLAGKILDSFIIGILTFFVLLVVKIPYPLLIAFIIGVTNIIPFFGPFIGAIPAFFIILFESTQQAWLFIIIIIIIQQIDGNIIGPKILGDSLGISPIWILTSLLVAEKFFGFIGLVIGVPLFVFIYSIVKEFIEARLKKKDLPTETKYYQKSNLDKNN